MVSPWGLDDVSTIAKEDGLVASRRRTVVTLTKIRSNGLKNWPWWGEEREKLSVQHSTFVTTIKRSLAKASIDPGFTSLLNPEDLEVMSMDQERISDGWLLHIDFSRTLTAQGNFYFYCFHLASRKGIEATRSSRFAARDQVDGAHPTRFLWRTGKASERVQ
jgi:hypothetical protein